MHPTIFMAVRFDMQLQMQKFEPATFYTFQNRAEITGPRIDINKIPQAGKDLGMIFWFKSMNL